MHENANLTYEANESERMLAVILSIEPRTVTSSGISNESRVLSIIVELIHELPPSLDTAKGSPDIFEVDEKGLLPSLTVFLLQEILRFNTLLQVIR